MNTRAQPSGALAEMLAADGELDRILSGGGLTFECAPVAPAPPPGPPLYIPPADWDAELRERQAAEREQQQQERERIVAEELAKITDDSEEPERYPAQPRKRRSWFTKEQP
jgi:hypothetical protein